MSGGVFLTVRNRSNQAKRLCAEGRTKELIKLANQELDKFD